MDQEQERARLELFVPMVPPGLNGGHGLIRMHWSRKRKVQDSICVHILSLLKAQGLHPPPAGALLRSPVKVLYHLHTCRSMDWDNVGASFKLVGDALVECNVLIDDSPKHIKHFSTDQTNKVPRDQRGFLLVIEEL